MNILTQQFFFPDSSHNTVQWKMGLLTTLPLHALPLSKFIDGNVDVAHLSFLLIEIPTIFHAHNITLLNKASCFDSKNCFSRASNIFGFV